MTDKEFDQTVQSLLDMGYVSLGADGRYRTTEEGRRAWEAELAQMRRAGPSYNAQLVLRAMTEQDAHTEQEIARAAELSEDQVREALHELDLLGLAERRTE